MKLYVGGLSFRATDEDVKQAFEQFGQVVGVNIITDRETGRSRGFCFVEMATDDEGQAAISGLDGKEITGRTVNVAQARERSPR
ncbi:RNA recognition motif domain-containing protein [Planctomycetota bacterium]